MVWFVSGVKCSFGCSDFLTDYRNVLAGYHQEMKSIVGPQCVVCLRFRDRVAVAVLRVERCWLSEQRRNQQSCQMVVNVQVSVCP